jgi:hypothetical protein
LALSPQTKRELPRACPEKGHAAVGGAMSRRDQQPDGDDTPGVAVAPVALAGAIMPGVDRFIVMLSAQADVFGVGATVDVGSMLVLPSSVIAGPIVPSGGLLGISGVESGKAAPLVAEPPGVELHVVVEELPSGDVGDMVPIVLPTLGVGMVPNGAPVVIAVDGIAVDGIVVAVLPAMDVETGFGIVDVDRASVLLIVDMEDVAGIADVGGIGIVVPGIVDMNEVPGVADNDNGAVVPSVVDVEEGAGTADGVGAADIDGIDPVVPLVADMDVTGTAGVPSVICPVGVEQVTTVPGVAGSEARGTGASVVSGTAGWVVAENGLGPLSGEDTIAPGVDGRPMAVVPMVETCARQASQPNSSAAVVKSKRGIAIPSAAPI